MPCECGFLRGIIEGTSAPVVILDRHLRCLYVNPAWSRVTGISAATFLGRKLGEVLPDVQTPDDVLIEVFADGQPRAERGDHAGCIAGALSFAEFREDLDATGFTDIEITPTHQAADGMHAAIVRAVKPAPSRSAHFGGPHG
jgi:PAS domain-containing protein